MGTFIIIAIVIVALIGWASSSNTQKQGNVVDMVAATSAQSTTKQTTVAPSTLGVDEWELMTREEKEVRELEMLIEAGIPKAAKIKTSKRIEEGTKNIREVKGLEKDEWIELGATEDYNAFYIYKNFPTDWNSNRKYVSQWVKKEVGYNINLLTLYVMPYNGHVLSAVRAIYCDDDGTITTEYTFESNIIYPPSNNTEKGVILEALLSQYKLKSATQMKAINEVVSAFPKELQSAMLHTAFSKKY